MRLLRKIAIKFVMMVAMVLLLGSGMRYGQRYIMQAAGMPVGLPAGEGPQFSSEESDLMSTVFKSALRLFSGSASRDELASELSDKLYSGRAGAGDMSELGIELVKPGQSSSTPEGGGGAGMAIPQPGAKVPAKQNSQNSQNPPGAPAKLPAKQGAVAGKQAAEQPPGNGPTALQSRVWKQVKANSMELGMVPVVLLGMFLVHRVRQRRSRDEAFMLPDLSMQMPADTEPFDMKHAVHSLTAEDFELLVALIYQRQGYRVSMPAGLGGGRGGDFVLVRKSERLLVQCKRLSKDHKVPVERVRELHEAVIAAGGATRGMFVASCSFSWDARNFAKTKRITLINARTLDELIAAAREKPDEDLLAVSQWVAKLMSKVELTPPQCPACEAKMDQINASNGSVWVCSQRPECRGRRSARKHQKPAPAATRSTEKHADEVSV